MDIDIISYSSAQYAQLSEEQLQEVKAAQVKKNRLTVKMTEEIRKEKARLVGNGTYLSPISELVLQKIKEKYEAEIEWVREGLLFYLQYASRVSESQESSNPYTVDYSLSLEERFEVVKQYYLSAYSDPTARFEAFKADEVAPQYLGELYMATYDYFLAFI